MDDLITLCRRYGCLNALNPETKDKREVAEELDKSSSTTYKHLRELAKHNVVKKTNDGYRLTNFGKVMRAKLEDAERAYEAQEVIEALNAPPEILSQGEYVPTQKHVPTGSLEEFTRHLKKAEDMCGLVPVLFPRYLDFHHQQILDGLDAEFVVEREVFEYIREEHGDIVNEPLEYGTRLYVTDAELPHGLALIDDTRVGVLVYNDRGMCWGTRRSRRPARGNISRRCTRSTERVLRGSNRNFRAKILAYKPFSPKFWRNGGVSPRPWL